MTTFQDLLRHAGIDPADVRLLRHASKTGRSQRSPFAAWQRDRPRFEEYQATQAMRNRRFFAAPYWASFVATPSGETMFVGLYEVGAVTGPVPPFTCPLSDVRNDGTTVDRFALRPSTKLREHVGRTIDWGPSPRAWRQYARRPKALVD